jgi:hypothetical protein
MLSSIIGVLDQFMCLLFGLCVSLLRFSFFSGLCHIIGWQQWIDNLNKKGMSKPPQCRFCDEESVNHLFFECVVARRILGYACEFLSMEQLGWSYISIAEKWLHKEKYYMVYMISSTVLRGVWLTRNDFVFNKLVWSDVKLVLRKVLKLSLEWKALYKSAKMEEMMNWCSFLELQIQKPLMLTKD